MASTTGRRVVEYLTNKSGGAVAVGDVVVVDTSNDGAFTTSTAGSFLGMVGVAQEAISNNAAGQVCTAGYVGLVNVNASVTRGHYGKTYTVAKQATDGGASRGAGAFCQFLTGGATPTAHLFGMADAATSSSGVPSGTSFPGGPSTNDLFYRTDLGLLAFYDGTRWLTTTLYREQVAVQDTLLPITSSGLGTGYLTTWGTDFQLYLVKFYATTNVLTTNDGTHYWTVVLQDDGGSTITGSSFNTSADTANTKTSHITTLNLAYTATNKLIQSFVTKTSTPGNLYLMPAVSYRLILT